MTDGSDDIDIEKLRVDPEFVQQARKSKHKNGGEFSPWCRGPGSCGCWMRSGSAPTSWHRASLHPLVDKGKPIAVTSKVAAAANLSARSKSRALAELEQLGLITVDRGCGLAARDAASRAERLNHERGRRGLDEALENVLRVCLPHEFRVQVLSALLDRDRDATPFRIISVGELMAMQFADFRAKREAYALMIQIMVRSITNNHSPETVQRFCS